MIDIVLLPRMGDQQLPHDQSILRGYERQVILLPLRRDVDDGLRQIAPRAGVILLSAGGRKRDRPRVTLEPEGHRVGLAFLDGESPRVLEAQIPGSSGRHGRHLDEDALLAFDGLFGVHGQEPGGVLLEVQVPAGNGLHVRPRALLEAGIVKQIDNLLRVDEGCCDKQEHQNENGYPNAMRRVCEPNHTCVFHLSHLPGTG
jgi:hypothetical protein